MDPLLLPLLFIAVLALPLILGSRRQKRAMAEAQRLQSSLTEGDQVMTTSGLQGTVVGSADETTIDLEIAPGVHTTWLRAAIREKITEPDEPAAASAPLAAPSMAALVPTSPNLVGIRKDFRIPTPPNAPMTALAQ